MYAISDEDVDASRRQAWRFWRTHEDWHLEPQDLAHEALYGLYMAALTFNPALGDWALHRHVKVDTAIRNGVRSELTRRRILATVALPTHDDGTPVDEAEFYVDPCATEDVAASREAIDRVVRFLWLERPLVADAVLRVDDDTTIARRYGTSLPAVANARSSFLRRYERLDDGLDPGVAAKCARCHNYARRGAACTACRASVPVLT
jgi:hypothetical protein